MQARLLNTLNEVNPDPGANLYLTLAIDMQKTAYDALGTFNGAVVAIDIKTGGVLVFVSRPGFDPNPFVVGIANDAYQALQSFVRFDPSGQAGTRVSVQMEYLPPAGVLGLAVAQLFGVDPRQAMNEDLMRLKSLLETGRTSSSKGTAELGTEESLDQ